MSKIRNTAYQNDSPMSTSTMTHALPKPIQPLLRIDLSKIANNVMFIQNKIGKDCQLMAVIKGNFYELGDEGNGSLKIISFLRKQGIKVFCVARFDEAIRLRQLKVQD